MVEPGQNSHGAGGRTGRTFFAEERAMKRNQALAAAALLDMLAAAAPARAIYLGNLKKNTTAQMEFTNQSTDRIAVTILLINRRNDISEALPYTIPAAGDGMSGVETIAVTIGDRIERVILLVDPIAGGLCVLRIDAGPAISMEGETRLTFDTEP